MQTKKGKVTMSNKISFDKDKATHDPIAILEGRFTIGDLMKVMHELGERTGKMPAAVFTGGIEVMSIVSSETGMPMVEMQSAAFDKPLQMDHAQAFEFAHVLMEATATSINDAMFFGFVVSWLGIPKEQAGQMLLALRDYRGRMLSTGDAKT
jgi:hypothetical protein